jgi:undecaprenyl-diphosphatase
VTARLELRQAALLGLVQGPAELLPVSSSAHTTLIPLLLDWPVVELDAGLRKSFDLALHAGAGLALALDMRRELLDAAAGLSPQRLAVLALSLAPPALAGLALRPTIERRLGGPRSIAAGLAFGSVAMALSDRRRGRGHAVRTREQARALDGLALGLAQSLALIPGVSRHGATLAAARARGFADADAQELSWHAGVGVMLGASALEGVRIARRPARERAPAQLLTGAAAAFTSTLLSARALRRRAPRSLTPFAIYRMALAAAVLAFTRRAARAKADPNRRAQTARAGLLAARAPGGR